MLLVSVLSSFVDVEQLRKIQIHLFPKGGVWKQIGGGEKATNFFVQVWSQSSLNCEGGCFGGSCEVVLKAVGHGLMVAEHARLISSR